MNAIVPYVGKLALRGAMARRSVNWAPYAGAAARVIGRAARSYLGRKRKGYASRMRPMRPRKKLFSKTHIGENNGTTTTKAFIQLNSNALNNSSRTLYTLNLTALQQGTEINNRLRQHSNIRGFKICMEISNTTNNPIYFNIAVIAPKRVADTTVDTLPTANFFRAQGTSRSQDFSNALTGLEFHCLPINTDDYTVLKHRRQVLTTYAQPSTSWNRQYGSSFTNINWYIPLKRQSRYLQTEGRAGPTDGAVYLAYWFATYGSASGTASIIIGNVTTRCVTYYREPKN